MKTNNDFTVIVDYSKSLEEMISSGNYDFVGIKAQQLIDFFNKHFGFPLGLNGKKVKLSVRIFAFNRSIYYDEIAKEMAKEGYRSANLFELLAFTENNFEIPKNVPIGSACAVYFDQTSCIPAVVVKQNKHILDRIYYNHEDTNILYLGVHVWEFV